MNPSFYMEINQQARKAVEKYDLGGSAEIVHQLEATHAAFQAKAGGRLYALRQFNSYMNEEDLRMQFRLTELMQDAGLKTPVPIRVRDGEVFVEVEHRLWALFPWCDGHFGRSDCIEDLSVLTSTQGAWVECCERLRPSPHWSKIVHSARKFRQRKSWAWVVPLDQVPRFAEEHKVIHRARCEAPEGPNREAFLNLLPEVYSGICKFEELLKQQGIHDLPHTVTHGDFWASNIIISDAEQAASSLPHREATVLDLDCYSFEPRITDFARAANWYYKERSESENAYLLKRFQKRARLSVEEIEALPLMMCAHDLYYAVGHVFLFLQEDRDGQSQMIAAIQREMRAAERYQRERDTILRMFLRSV